MRTCPRGMRASHAMRIALRPTPCAPRYVLVTCYAARVPRRVSAFSALPARCASLRFNLAFGQSFLTETTGWF